MRLRFALGFAGLNYCTAGRVDVSHQKLVTEEADGSVEKHLQIVDDYLANAPRQTFMENGAGLLQTFGPQSIGGGSCGDELCELDTPCPNYAQLPHCRFDVYDNALAAIYYTKRGKYPQAKKILNAFLYYLYPGYAAAHSYEVPSGEPLTMLAASYTDEETKAGRYEGHGVADGATDLGNNAYAGMAFARYAAATGDACYVTAAQDIMDVLSKQLGCYDEFGGYMGRLAPYPKFYRSIEHNIDMFAFANMLDMTAERDNARKFVQSMYDKDPTFRNVYVVGTHDAKKCDTEIGKEPICTDAQMWNVAAGADDNKARAKASFAFTLKPSIKATGAWGEGKARLQGLFENNTDHVGYKGKGIGQMYHGFRFTNWGNGIQWENAASAVIGMVKYRDEHGDDAGLTDKIVKVRNSLKRLLEVYRSVPSSVLGGNLKKYQKVQHWETYPGGSDTGMGWTYMRYPHLASTVWAGFALMQQAGEGLPVDSESNPYAPPHKAVPAAGPKQCIPHPTPSSSDCSLHPRCAGLGGDCCPTPNGMNLGCCD